MNYSTPHHATTFLRSLILICASTIHICAQQHLLFKSLVANPLEARIGTMYQFGDNKLRLDIGHSFDLMQIDSSSKMQWRCGGDFFTFTRLRSEGRLKFPVETVDYFFGVNTSCRWRKETYDYSLRVRLSHISAHLADGLANDSAVLRPKPFIYSREFIEAIGAYEASNYRVYGGLTAVFSDHTNSPRVQLLIPQAGIEYTYAICQSLSAFVAYDVKLSGIEGAASLVHAAQAGIKLPQLNSYELIISTYYYHGLSLHGLFYSTIDDYLGAGFLVGL